MHRVKAMHTIGTHTIIELLACGRGVNDSAHVAEALRGAVAAGRATLIDIKTHTFSPQGVTGVALLAESHLAIHTWPEHGYVAADFFTCGTEADHEAIVAYLREAFDAQDVNVRTMDRGPRRP